MHSEREAHNYSKERLQNVIENLKPNQYIRLRMLTPTEIFRLMGIDEEYIRPMVEDSDNVNSQLYKQAGNSIVVDVMYEIFRKMFIDTETEEGDSHELF